MLIDCAREAQAIFALPFCWLSHVFDLRLRLSVAHSQLFSFFEVFFHSLLHSHNERLLKTYFSGDTPKHFQQLRPLTQCPNSTPTAVGVGSVWGLGPDLVGIHSISPAARYRVAACSTTLSRGLEKISTARGQNCVPIFALSLSPFGKKSFLFPPWLLPLRMHLILFVG